MKTVKIIIQARLGSSRLKNKVLLKINNHSLISILLKRLSKSKYSKNILVAISKNKNDDALEKHLKELKVNYYRGSEDNVLKRFYKSITKPYPSAIVRVTADCPLLDYRILDKMIKNFFENKKYDYLSNTINQTYPVGMNIEIFTLTALKKAYRNYTKDYESEHVTPYIFMNPELFNIGQEHLSENYSNIRITVDFEEDFIVIKKILEIMYTKNKYFGLNDIIKLYKSNPEIFLINRHLTQKSF